VNKSQIPQSSGELRPIKKIESMKTFETERIILKPTTKEDAPFILDLFNSPKWIEFIGDRNVKTVKDTEDYIENKMTPQIERLGYGNFTIIRKFDGQKIGACGLYDREGIDGIDIGFALLPSFEKKGYAFESVNKLKEVAFSHFQLKEISGITSKNNKASQDLLTKIGLDFEKNIKLPNDDDEILLYKLKL
jgi:ribosomal-protein-alanine N-acetyltransferase